MNLPFSVIRDVPIVLQSYLDEKVIAEIIIHNEDGDFEFFDKENNGTSYAAIERKQTFTERWCGNKYSDQIQEHRFDWHQSDSCIGIGR